MSYQVLTTKLYVPPIQASLVQRPRLVQHLENGYQAGKLVTLVSAPAGFGKTTLIREWINDSQRAKPFGWLSLDDGDNDPVRFVLYLVSAIQKVRSGIGQGLLAALNAAHVPPLLELVEALINEILLTAKPFLLVVDDYHLIKKPEVHALMQVLLNRQPGPLHLVIITREDPPFPLPRMRVAGHLTEIREKDLRFTLPEAQTFLVRTMGLELSTHDVSRLEERTEGWAAGMQLAALALEEYANAAERRAFIEAFAGSNRMIVDYLISEVLQRQAGTTRQFLLRTSLLERFCAELCDAVVFEASGEGQSQMVLETLEKGNMFLVPLDDQRHWYRYHHLFSEMLFHSLRRSAPEEIPLLHRRASLWFEVHGLIPEAMQHALAGQVWDRVKDLMDRYALPIIFPGYGSLVIEWCRAIPRAYLEQSPDICVHYAWALVLTFREDYMDLVEEQLQLAERALQNAALPAWAPVGERRTPVPFRDWIIGHLCVIRSQILLGHLFKNIDPQELIDLSLKGLELLPEVEKTPRSICRINLAHAQTMQNDPVQAQTAFEEALPSMLEAGNFLGAVAAAFYLSRLALYRVNVDQAESVCRQWQQKFADLASAASANGPSGRDIPALRGLAVVESLLLLERDQFDEAERLLVQTLEILGWGSWMELHGFVELAHLRQTLGNHAGVQEVLQRMNRLGPQHAACAEALDLLFGLRHQPDNPAGRARAEAWTKAHAPDSAAAFALGIGPYHRDAEYLCNLYWSRIQIALGHFQAANTFVLPALTQARERGLLYRVAELSILHALVQAGLGQHAAALVELTRALEISETCGYARFFDDGPELDRLLRQAVEQSVHSGYARRMLAAAQARRSRQKASQAARQASPRQNSPVDPLSERELEVLSFLAEGLAPAEVAKRLYLSPFTLKAHTQNIYTKLGVHSRIEAINKARGLGLL